MKENRYFNVLAAFSIHIWLESGKICKTTITHICFIALTLATWFLGNGLKTWPSGIMIKQLATIISSQQKSPPARYGYNHTTSNLAIYYHETSQDKLSES